MLTQGLRIAFAYEAGLNSVTGVGRYTISLHRSLLAHPDVSMVRRCANFCWLDAAETRSGAFTDRLGRALWVRRKLDGLRAAARWLPAGEALRRSARGLLSNRFFAWGSVALYHEPNFVLREANLPAVVTVHDLAHLLYPKYLPTERVRFLDRELPRSLRAARRVITPSRQVRHELISTLGVDPKIVVAVPSGVDNFFRVREQADVEPTLRRLSLEWKSYLLFVGTLEPRKNLEGLLKAQRLLPDRLARRFPLVVAGASGWSNQRIEVELAENCRQGMAIKLGFIPDATLALLYGGARGIVLPTHYEGQGFPAFEGLASGTPVLTSPNSPMEEQLGSRLLYAPPGDDEALAHGLVQLIEDDGVRRRACADADYVRTNWSWERCADRTVAVYKDALADTTSSCERAHSLMP
jgi:alpha-1,3-rhamnosyl/mannosyltransferase